MTPDIPSSQAIRGRLLGLGHAQLQALSVASGVPFTTLWRVRSGETANPGIETVRKFMAHMPEAPDTTPQPVEQGAA